MSWIDKAKGELEKHALALDVIEGIAKLVADALIRPDSNAHAVLAAVKAGLDALIHGFDGKPITRADVEKIVADLTSRRAAMHVDIDQRLDDKFDGGGTP